MIPAYISALSLLLFLAQTVKIAFQSQKQSSASVENSTSGRLRRFWLHVHEVGLRLFLFRVTRLATCLALVMLSLVSPTPNASVRPWLLAAYVRLYVISTQYSSLDFFQQVYFCFLALLSAAAKFPYSRIATHHLNIVLLVPFVVYAYRDLWPLATYTSSPADGVEGKKLWFKIACITLAAVFLPLSAPRQYIPVDHQVSIGSFHRDFKCRLI